MSDECDMDADAAETPTAPGEAAASPVPGGELKPTRRTLLRAGLGLAAGAPLAGLLAACASAAPHAAQPTPTPGSTATSQPTATPDTRPITVAITGDIMLARSVNTMMLATSDRFPFTYTADYLKSFDLTVGNLECVVSTLGRPEPKQFVFEANPLGFQRLVTAGFDIVSVANNHSGDYGKQAFMDMLTHLPRYNIQPVGGGRNLAAAHTPVIRTLRTTTVGFLTYCEIGPDSFAATATTPGHAWLNSDLMRADIARVRKQVDYLIVFTHWGIEYQLDETAHQVAMAHLAIDAGADFVVGAHPHVRQPSEIYKGKPIVYSLGNFVFDLMPGPEESQGSVLALTIQGSKLLHWKLRTARIVGSYGEPRWE
jgi:poly-gamma-glutamate capsule biosynthesis protein CapA/YwtB (metallophosphatase superfamily)